MYVIIDSYYAPQTGYAETTFEHWFEVEDYLGSDPEVTERIYDGYAVIIERDDRSGEPAKVIGYEDLPEDEEPDGYSYERQYGYEALCDYYAELRGYEEAPTL